MTILIPAYEPDERLLTLITSLQQLSHAAILIINDGSGEEYQHIFDEADSLGCTVIHHTANLGKGRALKTGFSYLMDQNPEDDVICADSDGQHLPADIIKIQNSLAQHGHEIVLGSRKFTGNVPFRSKFGNSVTRWVFSFTTGMHIEDTQTGLRGYKASMLPWLCQIPGDRFQYEMNILLAAKKDGFSIVEEFIDTVYLDHNKSSHFRPLIDSIKIYLPIIMFGGSSILSAGLDFVLLLLMQSLTEELFLSVLFARLISASFNYTMNRKYVFHSSTGIQKSLLKYFSLAVLILLINYTLLYLYHEQLGIHLIIAKLLTEATLFIFSFWAQRKYVYPAIEQ